MEYRQLRPFVHIAQLGSISLAAERLNTVQPALSRQIQLLVADLGVRVFERAGRGVALTHGGETLVRRAEVILREVGQVAAELRNRDKIGGDISFGLPPAVSELSGPRIEQFAERHSDVELRVASGCSAHVLDWLQNGSVDLTVVYETRQNVADHQGRTADYRELVSHRACVGRSRVANRHFRRGGPESLVLPGPER